MSEPRKKLTIPDLRERKRSGERVVLASVTEGSFPDADHSYEMPAEEASKLEAALKATGRGKE